MALAVNPIWGLGSEKLHGMSAGMANRIEELRKARGLTQAELAEQVGTSQSQIDRLEKSQRRLTTDWMVRLAPALGVDPVDLMDSKKSHDAALIIPNRADMPQDLPVFGTAQGANGDGAFVINMGGQVGSIRRPPGVMNNPQAFAIYVEGDSMEPRFEPGETVVVDPNRPARTGDDVVIVVANSAPGQPPRSYIKRLVRRGADRIVVRQFNPPKEIEFPTNEVSKIFRVLRMNELLG